MNVMQQRNAWHARRMRFVKHWRTKLKKQERRQTGVKKKRHKWRHGAARKMQVLKPKGSLDQTKHQHQIDVLQT